MEMRKKIIMGLIVLLIAISCDKKKDDKKKDDKKNDSKTSEDSSKQNENDSDSAKTNNALPIGIGILATGAIAGIGFIIVKKKREEE